MARILIADDDANLRGTLEEVLKAAGHDVVAYSNGELALNAFAEMSAGGQAPDAAVLDLLLPKVAGLDLAQKLREQDPALKLVFMSGIFKSTGHKQDAEAKFAPLAYFSKPFDNAELTGIFEKAFGATMTAAPKVVVPDNPLPPEGLLLQSPVLHLLWRASEEHHTGVLDVFGGGGVRGRAFIFKGRLTFAQSSNPTVNVGVELVRRGLLTADMYKEAVQKTLETGKGLHAVIKEADWAADSDFKDAYKSISPRAVASFIAALGRFRWTEGDAFSKHVPAAPVDLLPVLKGAVRMATSADLAPHVDPRAPLRIAPGENWDVVGAMLDDACGSSSLLRAVNGRATIAQLIGAARTDDDRAMRYRQAFMLMSTLAVIASEDVIPMARAAEPDPSEFAAAAAPQPAAKMLVQQAAGSDEGIDFNHDEVLARRRIREKLAELKPKESPFEILGVVDDAPLGDVKKAYFNLAREWHTDAFVNFRLGSAADDLDTLFGLIQGAYATLTDAGKRAEYDAKRSMEQQGMSTDVAALFEAENDIHKGRLLLDRGEMLAAAKLFERARGVNPGNREWEALHLYTRWWQRKDPTEGGTTAAQLEAIAKEMPTVVDITYFAGHIYSEIGNVKRGRTLLKRVLEEDPQHHGATRILRTMQKAAEEEEKKAASAGGLMGRFLKR